MKYVKFITRQMLRDSPNTLFVFGDNMAERGFGGQAKEMRGEPNAVDVPTKLLPGMDPDDFFKDTDFDRAKIRIDAAFMRLFVHAAYGRQIVWPEAGIGTGLAQLKTRAPTIWVLIERYRTALERIDVGHRMVESEADPNMPGRTEYRITGPSRNAVQDKITELMDTVDVGGVTGRATFSAPVHTANGQWTSIGEIVVSK